MPYRIVHLADLHLDIPFASMGRGSHVSNARREGLRDALKLAFRMAEEWPADAITIGGDLYEANHVSPDTVQFLRELFEKAAPLRIIVAPGNHDPYTRASPYAYVDWPSNVDIFRDPKLIPIALGDGLTIWGAGHDSAEFVTPLLEGFRLPEPGPALLLLHGTDRSLSLGKNKGAYCPFSQDEVQEAGFDLALLGHIHHQRLQPVSRPFICYPGSPEPLGFDEESGHSIILAEWSGNGWKTEGRDISKWICRSEQVDISDFGSRDGVIERIRGLWKDERSAKRCLAQIDLTGQPGTSIELDLQAIRAALASDFDEVCLKDATIQPFDIEALRQDSTVTGAFVRRMLVELAQAEGGSDEQRVRVVRKALTFGLLALEQREIGIP
jgi:DNA repair exonuclease SbcCD nuclease subunit